MNKELTTNCGKLPFNLSSKIEKVSSCRKCFNQEVCFKEDVKEFIKLLKEQSKKDWDKGNYVLANTTEMIDKLAGDKLTGAKKNEK